MSYRLAYRLDCKQKVLTFDDEDEALRWQGVFNSVGPESALQMMESLLGKEPSKPAADVVTVRSVVEDHIDHAPKMSCGSRGRSRRETELDIYSYVSNLPIVALDRRVAEKWSKFLQSDERFMKGKLSPLSGKTIVNRHGLLCGREARGRARAHSGQPVGRPGPRPQRATGHARVIA